MGSMVLQWAYILNVQVQCFISNPLWCMITIRLQTPGYYYVTTQIHLFTIDATISRRVMVVADWFIHYVFGLWEETRAPKRNPSRHAEHMQTSYGNSATDWQLQTQKLLAVKIANYCNPQPKKTKQNTFNSLILFFFCFFFYVGYSKLKYVSLLQVFQS